MMNDVFGGVVGEHFIFPAVDTTKRKDVPLGLSRIHRKTPDAAGTSRFDRTIRLKANYASKVCWDLVKRNDA